MTFLLWSITAIAKEDMAKPSFNSLTSYSLLDIPDRPDRDACEGKPSGQVKANWLKPRLQGRGLSQ